MSHGYFKGFQKPSKGIRWDFMGASGVPVGFQVASGVCLWVLGVSRRVSMDLRKVQGAFQEHFRELSSNKRFQGNFMVVSGSFRCTSHRGV